MDEHIKEYRKAVYNRLRDKAYALNGFIGMLKKSDDFKDFGYALAEIYVGMLDLIDELEGDEG